MHKKISIYTLKKSTEHLYYEADMIYTALLSLTQPHNQIEKNIILDAFAIHTRNLFDFFYMKAKRYPSDMLATDFLAKRTEFNVSKTKRKDLAFVTRKADKQVAHLTYTRNRFSNRTKSWPYVDIGRKMHKTLNAFYNSLPMQYLNWPNIRNLKVVIDSTAHLFGT